MSRKSHQTKTVSYRLWQHTSAWSVLYPHNHSTRRTQRIPQWHGRNTVDMQNCLCNQPNSLDISNLAALKLFGISMSTPIFPPRQQLSWSCALTEHRWWWTVGHWRDPRSRFGYPHECVCRLAFARRSLWQRRSWKCPCRQ